MAVGLVFISSPVAFGTPAHGKLAHGPGGSVVNTPDAGFTGSDQLDVTTSDAVRADATDIPPIASPGGVPHRRQRLRLRPRGRATAGTTFRIAVV